MVVTAAEPDRLAPRPASAIGPPRGLGGGGALLRRHRWRGVRHVQQQTCADHQAAPHPKSGPKPARRPAERCALSATRGSKQARVLRLLRRPRGPPSPPSCEFTGWQSAFGAGVLCRRGAQEARAQARFRERRTASRVYRIAGGSEPTAIDSDTTATVQPA